MTAHITGTYVVVLLPDEAPLASHRSVADAVLAAVAGHGCTVLVSDAAVWPDSEPSRLIKQGDRIGAS